MEENDDFGSFCPMVFYVFCSSKDDVYPLLASPTPPQGPFPPARPAPPTEP